MSGGYRQDICNELAASLESIRSIFGEYSLRLWKVLSAALEGLIIFGKYQQRVSRCPHSGFLRVPAASGVYAACLRGLRIIFPGHPQQSSGSGF